MNIIVRKYCNWVKIVLPLFVAVVMVSCLKETPLPVIINIEAKNINKHNTSPLVVELTNTTAGADFYEWTFHGGKPETSTQKTPQNITFSKPGTHTIKLRAWNIATEAVDSIIVQVDSAVIPQFDLEILTNNFAPAQIKLTNNTTGASSFLWTFTGATPDTSTLQHPEIITINSPGTQNITLAASNGSQTFKSQKTIQIAPPLNAALALKIDPKDDDMQAPLIATLINTSTSHINTQWSCPNTQIANPTNDTTQIIFQNPGTYTITLSTDNIKEAQTTQTQLTVLPSSGIRKFNNIELGIYQTRNTIGSLFSADLKRTLKSNEITADNGALIDFGFYALNSNLTHCYFFSPDRATSALFPEIPGAITTYTSNTPLTQITPTEFNAITNDTQLEKYTYPSTVSSQSFSLDRLPQFYALKTEDNRKILIYIKDVVDYGEQSFIVSDIIIEKRAYD